MLYSPDLKVGGLYQFSGDLVNGKRWFEVALYDGINEYFQHAKNTVILDMFVLLERRARISVSWTLLAKDPNDYWRCWLGYC